MRYRAPEHCSDPREDAQHLVQEPPKVGDQVDALEMVEEIFDGRYSRLLKARDTRDERIVVLKFPQPRVADDAAC